LRFFRDEIMALVEAMDLAHRGGVPGEIFPSNF
jgi:hypothetical protein